MTEVPRISGGWFVVPYGNGSSLVIHSSDDERVCFMATASADRPTSRARIVANARLIAAAPDLLEAIKPLVFSDPAAPPPGVDVRDWGDAVMAARAAHGKARGDAA